MSCNMKNPNQDLAEISDYPGDLNGNVRFVRNME